jgi:hypothetical protein
MGAFLEPDSRTLQLRTSELRGGGARWLMAVSLPLLFPLAVILLEVTMLHHARAVADPLLLLVLMPMVGSGSALLARRPRIRRGVVDVDGGGISLDGRRVVPRRRIRAGDIVLAPDGVLTVLIQQRGIAPALQVTVRDEAEGEAVLDALGLGGKAAAVSLPTGYALSYAGAAGGLIVMIASAALVFAFGAPAGLGFTSTIGATMFVAILALVVSSRPKRVSVGTDGVVIAAICGRHRFVAHRNIEELTFDGRHLVMRSNARTSRFPLLPARPDSSPAAAAYRQNALARRIAELRTLGLHGGTSRPEIALEPSTAALAAAIGARGYRDPVVTRDAVWAILEDPAAPRVARARSAAALRVSADERPRLRVAVTSTADPELREELEEVLEECSRAAKHATR